MKKARKGFTLVELLIVIGIMGTLGAMGMMAGQQATDAAKAANIAENLQKASTAMLAYYEENYETIDVSGTTIADVVKGANAYLKKGSLIAGTAAGVGEDSEGKYSVIVTDATSAASWYVAYTLLGNEASGNVGAALANKATRLQLKDKAVKVEATEAVGNVGDANYVPAQAEQPINPYDGGDTVYMFVR